VDMGNPGDEFEGRMLPPIGATGAWKQASPFLEESAARLEGCRQRLAAADKAVSKAAALSTTFKPEDEINMLQRQLDEVIRYGSTCGDNQGDAGSGLPPGSAFSGGREAMGQSSYSQSHASADEALDAQASVGTQDVRSQLGTIEGQLLELDKKWRSAEKERREGNVLRSELAERLKAEQAAKEALQAELSQLKKLHTAGEANERRLAGDLGKSQAANEKLRKELGVSEATVHDLQSQISDLQGREAVLTSQLNTAHARIYATESECQVLSERLTASEQSNEDLTERLNTADANGEEAWAAHAEESAARSEAERGRDDAEAAILAAEQAGQDALANAEAVRAGEAAAASEVLEERDQHLKEKDRLLAEKDLIVKGTSNKLAEKERSHAELARQLKSEEKSHSEVVAKHAQLDKDHKAQLLAEQNRPKGGAAGDTAALAERVLELQTQLQESDTMRWKHKDDIQALHSRLQASEAASMEMATQAASFKDAAAIADADAKTAREALSGSPEDGAAALAQALEEKAESDRTAQESQLSLQKLQIQLETALAESAAQAARAEELVARASVADSSAQASAQMVVEGKKAEAKKLRTGIMQARARDQLKQASKDGRLQTTLDKIKGKRSADP